MTAKLYKFPPIGECDPDERVYHIPSRDERPNLIDALAAENAQRDVALHLKRLARQAKWRGRFGFANRATREPSQSSLSRPSGRVSAIAWDDVLFGAACGLLAGMLGTVGLAYVVGLFL